MGRMNEFLTHLLNGGFVNVFVTIIVMICGTYLFNGTERRQYLLLCLILLPIIIAVNFLAGLLKRRILAGRILQMPFYREVNGKGLATVRDFKLPMIFINEQGDLIWHNEEF